MTSFLIARSHQEQHSTCSPPSKLVITIIIMSGGVMALCDCEVLQCQGRSKENLYAYAWLSHKSFHMFRSSCAA